MKKLSDEEIPAKLAEYRNEVQSGARTLDDVLPEVFALVREASSRVMGMRHYDVQLVGGMVLHAGKIAEMKTGEGKTLVATLPVVLNALSGKGVHVVTVNDYLARRDAEWMGRLYNFLGLAVGVILISGVMDFNEIRNSISAPIILMSAGVIGIADALGNTGLTSLVGETVAKMLGTNVNPFVLIFAFCILTSVLATLTGSTIGTVYVFAPMAIATCVNLGLDPTAAAAAIVVSGWCGHFLPIDGMPAMIMGAGDYKITEFWKFTIPQYFIRLLALTVGAVLIFPMK